VDKWYNGTIVTTISFILLFCVNNTMTLLNKVSTYIIKPNWVTYVCVVTVFSLYYLCTTSYNNDKPKTIGQVNSKILREEAKHCLYYHPRFIKDVYGSPVKYQFIADEDKFHVIISSVSYGNDGKDDYSTLDMVMESITWEELEKFNDEND
jgi:hypothetical protein